MPVNSDSFFCVIRASLTFSLNGNFFFFATAIFRNLNVKLKINFETSKNNYYFRGMGYTMEGGKVVIWTQKIGEAADYPFQDDVTNYTYFYENLKDRRPFATCFASIPDTEKIQLVAEKLALAVDKIVLRSKKSHYKKNRSS